MVSWTVFLIGLVIVVVILVRRGRRGVRVMGHGHLIGLGRPRKMFPDLQLQSVDDWTTDTRKAPHLEYQGEVYFFCSIEERDVFSENLQYGEFHPSATANIPRAIERRA